MLSSTSNECQLTLTAPETRQAAASSSNVAANTREEKTGAPGHGQR
jgi:hypothetical protein